MTLSDPGGGRKGASPTPVTRCRSDQPVVNNRGSVDDDGGKYTAEMHRTESFKDSAGHTSKGVAISVLIVSVLPLVSFLLGVRLVMCYCCMDTFVIFLLLPVVGLFSSLFFLLCLSWIHNPPILAVAFLVFCSLIVSLSQIFFGNLHMLLLNPSS